MLILLLRACLQSPRARLAEVRGSRVYSGVNEHAEGERNDIIGLCRQALNNCDIFRFYNAVATFFAFVNAGYAV